MLRFEHQEPIIVAYSHNEQFKLALLTIEAKVISPNTNSNCLLEFSTMKNIDDKNYEFPEEAEMQAVINGNINADKHLPILSFKNVTTGFDKWCHLFPLSKELAVEKIKERINELDMFTEFAND